MNNADLEKLKHRLDEQENRIESICRENRLLKRLMIPLGIGCLVLIGSFLWGGQITIPNTFSGGTLITASQINANFSTLVNESNAQDARISNLEKIRIHKPIPYASGSLDSSGTAFRSGSFTSMGGDLLVMTTASAFGSADATLQVDVKLDGILQASLKKYANEGSSHKTLVSDFIFIQAVSAGTHSISLTLVSGTVDQNDYSQITILEIPN